MKRTIPISEEVGEDQEVRHLGVAQSNSPSDKQSLVHLLAKSIELSDYFKESAEARAAALSGDWSHFGSKRDARADALADLALLVAHLLRALSDREQGERKRSAPPESTRA